MKRPIHRRQIRQTDFTALKSISLHARYESSSEHKLPGARSDASICPKSLSHQQSFLTSELQRAISMGHVDPVCENSFPRKVWCRINNEIFEGRLTNREQGVYKGYPITSDELPRHLRGLV